MHQMIKPAPSQTLNVTFSTFRPIKMGESIKTTGIVKPPKLITIAMGAKAIATQRDNVPIPSNVPAMNNKTTPFLEYKFFWGLDTKMVTIQQNKTICNCTERHSYGNSKKRRRDRFKSVSNKNGTA